MLCILVFAISKCMNLVLASGIFALVSDMQATSHDVDPPSEDDKKVFYDLEKDRFPEIPSIPLVPFTIKMRSPGRRFRGLSRQAVPMLLSMRQSAGTTGMTCEGLEHRVSPSLMLDFVKQYSTLH
ncbi:hypothetical protein OBBRIDRAFT_619418 [Obba rivulosa]|uniref:Uncharacterized protein n=1 Tax=Obba rivulosa TaxID=1052685 RepID=A0A8E2AXW9_9APHY|nr:hypothetical protein OBBRIDRAFT_619418 [Obba rivulosa]